MEYIEIKHAFWRRQRHPTPVLLPGKSHGRRSLVGCSPWGPQRVRQDWVTSLSLFTFMHWRRKWQPTPVFLPGESQGWNLHLLHPLNWQAASLPLAPPGKPICILSYLIAQSCPTLCDPMDTRLLCPWDSPGKSTGVGCHFLLQGTSQPRDPTWVSCIAGGFFTHWGKHSIQSNKSFKFYKKCK